MGKVLYRKYRSKSLSEVLGQEAITTALSNALAKGKLSHAYLFTGPRGVGKTSTARILAHEVNNLPYDEKTPNIDIIEIDAASNRRIGEIRDLRDKVFITPSRAKYKVYIIDEVHMLTTEAFNALLKTLEEPPEHVIFILATTEVSKLPDTIISRTQRYNFKPISTEDVVSHLRYIAKQEGVKATDGALEILAQKGEGSFRDSISLFDQISSSNKDISEEDVLSQLGIPSKKLIESIISLINDAGTYKKGAEIISDMYQQGYEATDIADTLMKEIRNRFINNELSLSKQKTIQLLDDLLNVKPSIDPKSKLELVLLSNINQDAVEIEIPQEINAVQPKAQKTQIKNDIEPSTTVETNPELSQNKIKANNPDYWNAVMEDLKKNNNTLYGIMNSANVSASDNQVEIVFQFPFHEKKINEIKNKEILTKLIKKHVGNNITLITSVKNIKKENIAKITNIFKGATSEDIDK